MHTQGLNFTKPFARMSLAFCIACTGSLLSCTTTSAATILSASATVSPLNEDNARDEETSDDPDLDAFVDASVAETGTFFGSAVADVKASASVNYSSGALKARSEATSLSDSAGGSGATAVARLFDELTFRVEPSAKSREVKFLWQVQREIVGEQGSVSGFFQVRDGVGSFGNTLVNDQFGGIGAFTDSGTYTNSATIALPMLPSSHAPSLRIEYLLRAQASVYSVLVDGGTRSDFRSSLADAGNTAYLNIITPPGISFEGSGKGFLATAPDLRSVPAVPAPASGLLLVAALSCIGAIRRYRT